MKGDLSDPSRSDKKALRDRLTRTEIVLALALAGVIVYLIYNQTTEVAPPPECENPACYRSIIEIEDHLDPSSDPCLDFQEFACGGFFGTAYKKQITSPMIQEELQLRNELDTIIAEPISQEHPHANKILNSFFRACMDVDEIDANHDRIVVSLIKEICGWPLDEGRNWTPKNFDWTKTMIKCKQLGLPFQWFLAFDLHVEDINYLKISFPTVSDLPANVKMSNMEKIMGGLMDLKVDVKEILDFDERLVQIVKLQNPEPHLASISALQTFHPLFNWLDVLNNITGDSYELSGDTEVASNVREYIVQLYQLLKGTSEKIQLNYIIWKIVEHFAPFMSSRVRKHVDVERRSDLCRSKAEENFPYFAELIYVSKYSKKEVRESVRDLTKVIRQEFLNRVEQSTWWNLTAGQSYCDRFKNTEVDFAGPEDMSEEFLEANYWHLENLTFDTDNPNIIEIITKRWQCYYDSLFSGINKTGVDPEVKYIPLDAKILYQKSLNKIVVAPPVLHGFLYDQDRPQYLNFASLGTLLAREFIRSLQELTREDEDVVNVAFEASTKCFEEDYLTMTSDNTTLYYVEEIIPDIVARDIAYQAYQNWVTTNGQEEALPLLSYDPNQLFWIKSSLINCHKKLTDVEDKNFEVMVSKYKNIFSVRHSRRFAEDFGCREDAPMNPSNKC